MKPREQFVAPFGDMPWCRAFPNDRDRSKPVKSPVVAHSILADTTSSGPIDATCSAYWKLIAGSVTLGSVDAYLEIERRTGFRIPDIYRRMREDGVCDYAGSPAEWQVVWRRRTLENPPALLGALDFEWLTLDDMISWSPPDYLAV